MKRLLLLIACVGGLVAVPAAAHASWVGDHCITDHNPDPVFKRADARAYADVADGEGYEYGGGCLNNNNQDDTPGQPDSGGEGPDCSGLVFKAWELRAVKGADGGTWWNKFEGIHGPYASWDYEIPEATEPFHKLDNKKRATTVYMDAFASDGHVALIQTNYGPSADNDYINEAKCDACGTDVFVETYRFNDAYAAVRREGWVPDCYPQCQWKNTHPVVVTVP